jgi:hypothetical protein
MELTSSFFWTDSTNNAIWQYQLESDYSKRDEIYNEYLYKPIKQLCEWVAFNMNNLIYIRENIGEAIKESQSHVTISLKNVKQGKGNPFSYLVTACRTYLIHFNMVHCKYYLNNTDELNEAIIKEEKDAVDIEYRKCVIQFWMRNAKRQFPRRIEPEKFLMDILNNSKHIHRNYKQKIKLFNRMLREHYLKYGNLDGCDDLLIEKKAKSPLTKNDILEIRELYNQGNINQRQLAEQFKVTSRTICDIVRNKSWKL